MIRCFELAPYQSRKRRIKQKDREVSQKNCKVTPVCLFQPYLIHSNSTHTYISEKQEKKQIIFLYISLLLFLPEHNIINYKVSIVNH